MAKRVISLDEVLMDQDASRMLRLRNRVSRKSPQGPKPLEYVRGKSSTRVKQNGPSDETVCQEFCFRGPPGPAWSICDWEDPSNAYSSEPIEK